jgi:hypothetical protein
MGLFDGYGYEPPQTDNNNVSKSLNLTEGLVVGGVQYYNPMIPGSVSGTSKNNVPLPMYPDFETSSSSMEQDRAARSQGNTDSYRLAETFDMRNANVALAYTSGQARASSIYIPYRQKLVNIETQMTDLNVGGTYSFIGWKLYGPLAVDPSTGTTPMNALPLVTSTGAFAPLPAARDQLISAAGDTGGGLFIQTADTTIDVGPGVYYLVQLLVSSVAPTTAPTWLGHVPPAGIGSTNWRLNASYVPHVLFLNGQTALGTTLDLTAYTVTTGKQWFAINTNASYV